MDIIRRGGTIVYSGVKGSLPPAEVSRADTILYVGNDGAIDVLKDTSTAVRKKIYQRVFDAIDEIKTKMDNTVNRNSKSGYKSAIRVIKKQFGLK